ncbi:Aste57867_23630 [Aphanomyces stellatus]|uniref:Aste57867_23630 protein n=1 Tax=Aphanomyces stellatus TaxID=120398 RepID=A0A485LSQ7_9STRA|nr:hypothetical protein As57867_023558 [Aphanomyces stellatus]VFU00275.1 Aste57867_23630 [Aphanomyces stellatus]
MTKIARQEAALMQFDVNIHFPSPEHTDATKPLAHVVWTSAHSNGQKEPRKTFDSSFKTATEANERARVVFYVENPFGMTMGDALMNFRPVAEVRAHREQCLHLETYFIERWTVAVEPVAVFQSTQVAPQRLVHKGNDDDYCSPQANQTSSTCCRRRRWKTALCGSYPYARANNPEMLLKAAA